MTVYKNSRYYDGDSQQIQNKTSKLYAWTVYRQFPGSVPIRYSDYTWVDGDRIDYLASVYLYDAKLWWKIMDINPEINDPFSIAPGTIIRIPRD